MRIFWLFNHPAPYKIALFNCLGKENELTVYFERANEKGRNALFYASKPNTFHALIGHPLKLGGFNNYSRKPIKHLEEAKPYDVIVLNGWRTMTERAVIKYCRWHKIPYVFYINGGIINPKENNIVHWIKTHYISKAFLYMAPDPNSAEYLKYYGADPERIVSYPYGSIYEDEILPAPYDQKAVEKLRRKLSVNGGRVFVSAGYFIERKNFLSLIRIWARMPKDNSLYLIGEGKLRNQYLREIKRLKLQDNVHVLPYMDHKELFRFYRCCDGFVFPSKEDIYGHVVAEAMSQGLPVYGSAHSNAVKALVRQWENGAIVDFDNPEEVVLALTRPMNHDVKEKALETAHLYTYEASAAAHQTIFEKYVKDIEKQK